MVDRLSRCAESHILYRPRSFLLIPHPGITRGRIVTAWRAGIWLVTFGAAQPWPIPPIAPVCNRPTKQGANTHVPDVVSVVLAPTNGDPRCDQKRREAQQGPAQIATDKPLAATAWSRDMGKYACLASEEQTQVSQARKCKGGVARRERAPTIVQEGRSCFCADVNGDEDIPRCILSRLAAS